MMCSKLYAFVLYINMCRVETAKLDVVKCGVDDADTTEGAVLNRQYPWLGVLFYSMYNGLGETRSVTTVVLIHVEFVIANSADIGPMPKQSFRDYARVLVGEGWEREGRRVRNYIVHPEYQETINSVAIVHLRQPVRTNRIVPICPPPERIRYPKFWVVKFEDKLEELKKQVLPVVDVPADQCRDFYINRGLYEARRRPSFVKCTVSLAERSPCVWNAGAALATRDVWGRWQLLGLGVYGPGCGAPARFLDMLRYYPWIEDTLDKFQRITISQIHKHKYVLRSGSHPGSLMRFGECDDYEKQNLIYRDYVRLDTDTHQLKTMKYNMTIYDTVKYTCVVFELRYASTSAELRVRHFCPRGVNGPSCYAYKGTRFDITADVYFTTRCLLDIRAYGVQLNMTLLDIELWKFEEGTYYEDFRLTPEEYHGSSDMTQFGFEPLDEAMWIPDYDQWSTTPFTLNKTSTERYTQQAKVRRLEAVKLDLTSCGADEEETVEGPVLNSQYPWLGVLFYSQYGGLGETRSVTTVVLIHEEFVIANSADIGPMPKQTFRYNARVLLGEGWEHGGRRVRNYIVHPEYQETINTVAIVHLNQPVRDRKIMPVCPPASRLRELQFWVVKFDDNLDVLQKRVLPMADVRADICRDFYIGRGLYEAKRRPSFVKCAVSLADKTPCVWGAGAALTTRDVWGQWQLLGLGVYGPGCGAPSRFLDMLRYYPWIKDSLDKFQRVTISQIHKHKYVLRSGTEYGSLMRFGECDDYEKQNLIYRDSVHLHVDTNNFHSFKYNMTIFDSVKYTCLEFELRRASASAELRVRHFCPRGPSRTACYAYKGTRFDIAVDVAFTEGCMLDIHAYGVHVNMSLLDLSLWKWEEGTYYEDFRLTPSEYRGAQPDTMFGFEPLDDSLWIPDYDRWSTTPFTIQTTTERFSQTARDWAMHDYFDFKASTPSTVATTMNPLKKFSKKTRRKSNWKLFAEGAEKVFKDIGKWIQNVWGAFWG